MSVGPDFVTTCVKPLADPLKLTNEPSELHSPAHFGRMLE